MHSATHSPSSIIHTTQNDIPALELGVAHAATSQSEVPASQVQLPSTIQGIPPASLLDQGVQLPGAFPEEPQESAADGQTTVAMRSVDQSETTRDELQPTVIHTDRKHAEASSQMLQKSSAPATQGPQHQAMGADSFELECSLKFGRGSSECQQCAECCACCGVSFLGL